MENNLKQHIVLGVKIIHRILRNKKWKWHIKYSEKNLSVVCRSNKSRLKKRINNCYKNKLKTYYVKCRKDTENIDPKMVKTKNNRLVMQSKCSVCGIKKSRFVKEQEAKGLLSNLGIKTLLSKIPLLNVLF